MGSHNWTLLDQQHKKQKAAPTIEDFPYLENKEAAGARISINTDNRTVSDTDLTKEYALYHQHFQTKETDFYQHNISAISRLPLLVRRKSKELLTKLKKLHQTIYKCKN